MFFRLFKRMAEAISFVGMRSSGKDTLVVYLPFALQIQSDCSIKFSVGTKCNEAEVRITVELTGII